MKTVTLTFHELLGINAALGSVLSTALPAKTAFRIGVLARTLSPHLQAALEVKMGVYGKYGKKDEQGMIRVPDAKMEALTTELNALKSETVEVAVPLLTEEDFSAAQITPAQALSLLPLIETPTEAQSNESK